MTSDAVVRRRLAEFRPNGYDKGRPRWVQAIWFATMNLVFMKWWCPAAVRVGLLRMFGADVGAGVLIRHRVRVLWPWKLRIGDHAWIGEGVWLLNLEVIEIGHDACLSQEAFICTGSHQRHSETFAYDNGPITIEPSAWIGARATVLRGVTVGEGATVAAGATASRDVASGELRL